MDELEATMTYTEELSQTDEYGVMDWNCLGLAVRPAWMSRDFRDRFVDGAGQSGFSPGHREAGFPVRAGHAFAGLGIGSTGWWRGIGEGIMKVAGPLDSEERL